MKPHILVVNKRDIHGPDLRYTEVYIGRPSPLGNPFKIGQDGPREEVIRKYRAWLKERLKDDLDVLGVINALNEIRWLTERYDGIKLVCWCAPQACHGDVIKEVLDAS
jgi:hypothetical protein